MSEKRQPTFNPAELLEEYADKIATANATAVAFLHEALPVVNDIAAVNEALTANGRPDLVITSPAPLSNIASCPDENRGTNFNAAFIFSIGARPTGEMIGSGDLAYPETEGIPVTEADLDALRDIPIIQDFDHHQALKEQGYRALYDVTNHTQHTAFLRMLVLFPDFTKDLVLQSSDKTRERFGLEFKQYAAYQIMFRLIDTTDPGYLKEDGTPDDWYMRH